MTTNVFPNMYYVYLEPSCECFERIVFCDVHEDKSLTLGITILAKLDFKIVLKNGIPNWSNSILTRI